MTQFITPKLHVADRQRATECRTACTKALAQLIDQAVEMGWRREEIAVQLADAADDYVLYLASNSIKKKTTSANDDGRRSSEQGHSEGPSKTTISSPGLVLRVK